MLVAPERAAFRFSFNPRRMSRGLFSRMEMAGSGRSEFSRLPLGIGWTSRLYGAWLNDRQQSRSPVHSLVLTYMYDVLGGPVGNRLSETPYC